MNRIFEGTNEINRLLIAGMLVQRALKGDLPLVAAAKRLQDEILAPCRPAIGSATRGRWPPRWRTVAAFKQVGLMVLGTAMQTYGDSDRDAAGSAELRRRHPR